MNPEIKAEQKRLRDLEDIIQLRAMPGWEALYSTFREEMRQTMAKLLIEKSPEEVVRLQERFKAYYEMLASVGAASSMADLVRYNIDKMITFEQEREETGLQ